jgi:hypothetical protein
MEKVKKSVLCYLRFFALAVHLSWSEGEVYLRPVIRYTAKYYILCHKQRPSIRALTEHTDCSSYITIQTS